MSATTFKLPQTKGKIRIHFVCRGNVYRSRMAAIYMGTKYPQYEVTSSGVDAFYPPRYLSPLARKALRKHGYNPALSSRVQRLMQMHIEQNDMVIYLDGSVYRDAKARLALNPDQSIVWHVKDWGQIAPAGTTLDDPAAVLIGETTLGLIASKIDELVASLEHQAWVDIVDEHNQPLGYRLPIGWANDRGRWHRGCRALIRTQSGRYLIEKRSDSIMFAPGMLDLSLGGGVDTGETPLAALKRELHEELGLRVSPTAIKPLSVIKWSRYHPHYKTHTRVFLYSYLVSLPGEIAHVKLQPSEVAATYTFSPAQTRQLISRHRLKHFGRLMYGYKHFSTLFEQAEQMSSN